VLDPALLRPGRFDRQVVVPVPDVNGREKVLLVHMKKLPLAPDVEPRVIARGTPGFSGADLANLANEAALLAARRDRRVVTMEDFESAKDKVMMGAERRSLVMTDEEKRLTAYHEGGHAIVTLHSPASDPIHKATIIPRGRALGLVMRLPEGDRLSVTREKLKADIAVAMGGRVAEVLIFGYDKVTSGASSDIQQATRMATAMVSEWGMSDKIGPIFHGGENRDVYLGGKGTQTVHSEHTANLIDSEVKKMVEEGYVRAETILKERIGDLHKLAAALLEYEMLSGDEIKALLAGKKIRDNNDKDGHAKKQTASTIPNVGDAKPPVGLEDGDAYSA
jgi:cell division protease FtsH